MQNNLESQLKAFAKTDKFKKLFADKAKIDPKFAGSVGGGTEKLAKDLGQRIRDILRDEIEMSNNDGRNPIEFLDYIIVEKEFVPGTGWIINVSFDEDAVTRNSLYWQNPKYVMGAYLPVLFNEGYTAKDYVYGYNNNGDKIRSRLHRDALHFIQRAVDVFNAEQKGIAVAEYSDKYSGGTF